MSGLILVGGEVAADQLQAQTPTHAPQTLNDASGLTRWAAKWLHINPNPEP